MLACAALRLSVIVPVYDERACLLRTIGWIDAVPPLLVTIASGTMRGVVRKIVLVDAGSTDGARELAGRISGSRVRRLRRRPSGSSWLHQ